MCRSNQRRAGAIHLNTSPRLEKRQLSARPWAVARPGDAHATTKPHSHITLHRVHSRHPAFTAPRLQSMHGADIDATVTTEPRQDSSPATPPQLHIARGYLSAPFTAHTAATHSSNITQHENGARHEHLSQSYARSPPRSRPRAPRASASPARSTRCGTRRCRPTAPCARTSARFP